MSIDEHFRNSITYVARPLELSHDGDVAYLSGLPRQLRLVSCAGY